MPLDLELNYGPLDQDDPTYTHVLEDLQGNILNGHGRDHAVHIFIAFDKPDQIDQVKAWITELAKHQITSAKAQLDGTEAYKRNKIDAGIFTHFALSANGYRCLGIAPEQQPKKSNPQLRSEDAFQEGLKKRQGVLLDPPSSEWESGFQNTIDAVLILANDDPAELVAKQLDIVGQLKEIVTIVTVERGLTLRRKFETVDITNPSNEFGVVVEHFGYADGVSQPIFLKKQYEREKSTRGVRFWDPAAPLKLVLVPDPLGQKVGVSFGSFLVFRKLEQNVRCFKAAEAKLAEELKLPRELAGAMAVGRYEDGSPIVLQPGNGAWASPEKPAIPNDFNYKSDSLGLACPFHAHIRKSNPRLESVGIFAKSKEEELGHRIARRGITYGGPLSTSADLEDLPTQGVGLLFICYQSDISEQFEFIQRLWCNNPVFLEPGPPERINPNPNPHYKLTGLDAVIGQKQGDQVDPLIGQAPKPPQNWPQAWGKPTIQPEIPPELQFGQFVTLKGGEYFFSPSISFLKNLI